MDGADLQLLLTAAEEALDSCSCSRTWFCWPVERSKLPNASLHCAVEAISWEAFHELRIFKMLFGDRRGSFDFEQSSGKKPQRLRNLEAKYNVKWKAALS